jgi:hypothetical protein
MIYENYISRHRKYLNEYNDENDVFDQIKDLYRNDSNFEITNNVTLEEALSSDLPIYTKATRIPEKLGLRIKHISKAIANNDAILIDSNHLRFNKDVYIFNVLHNIIKKVNSSTVYKF